MWLDVNIDIDYHQQVQAAANLNGLQIEAPSDFAMGKTNRSPEFLAKFPMGKVPAFAGTDGTNIFDSDAIAQYAAESGPAAGQLLGTTPAQRAQIRQWICFGSSEVTDPVTQLMLWRVGLTAYNETAEKTALARLERSLSTLEGYLKGRTWVATNDKLSLADISVAAGLRTGLALVIDADMRKKYPTTIEWYERTVETDGVKQAFGEKTYIEKRKESP